MDIAKIDLKNFVFDNQFSCKLAEGYARRLHAILLSESGDSYLVGMANPGDIFAVDELTAILQHKITPVLVNADDLTQRIDQLYRRTKEISTFASKLAHELSEGNQVIDASDSQEKSHADPAVIKLLTSLLEDALQVNASDVHIEPAEGLLRIRLRIDGRLQEQTIPIVGREYVAEALVQHLKLKAGLNIAEKRLPQDGRFDETIRDRQIEIRLSTLPVRFGEAVVLRLLDKNLQILNLEHSGMPDSMLKLFRTHIHRNNGIVLVTGPTGSGKTTTLYGALSEINDVSKNIVTIEDPIEYTLERVNQVQINTKIDLSFARVLRAVLRQDPNIILIGEIRDYETASIAMRAALTGHLVFATLHTNDAASTAIRLLDIGVESYLVAVTVRLIVAQRLIRRICPVCAEPYTPSEREAEFFCGLVGERFKKASFYHGKGCSYCNFTGYRGRIGVFEMLEFDNAMRAALRRRDTDLFVQLAQKANAGKTLFDQAYNLAEQKMVTLNEVMYLFGG